MFSQDDILDIFRLLPPETWAQSTKYHGLPLLVKANTGNDFITARSLHRRFERLLTTGTARTSASAASSHLNVDLDVMLQLVRENPTLALLSQDGNSIVPKEERDAIVKDLEDMLAKQLVYKAEFIQSRDLHRESLGRLLRIPKIGESLKNDTEDYSLSKAYSTALSAEIIQKLEQGIESAETIELTPLSLHGTPPVWLIQQTLDRLSGDRQDHLSHYHIEKNTNVIRCIPKQSIMSQRDELIAELQSGEIFSFDIEGFGITFRELYQSSKALEKHILESPSVTMIGTFAVSTERLSQFTDRAKRALGEQGYFNLNTMLEPEVPREIEDDVRDNVVGRIQSTTSNDDKPIRQVGDYLLMDETYDKQQQALLAITKAQADRQWDLVKETPDKDPKFQMAEVLASVPDHEHVLRAVAQQRETETAAAEQFSNALSNLESENENEFSTFWLERVSLRVHNHHEGLKSIDDMKLHEQLADLLSTYLHKDLLPDSISKARSQGLVRSRRTRKNVNRFEATLKASKTDLFSILSTLEKFSKKQGLAAMNPEAAEEAKSASIQDMIRRMQKPKTDAPSMFLSLVVILFAKHHSGVVYATGKFAPKLLKQLKTKLSEYEKVEKWKDQAKTGTLNKEDKEFMVQMAENAPR